VSPLLDELDDVELDESDEADDGLELLDVDWYSVEDDDSLDSLLLDDESEDADDGEELLLDVD
jgi:hypothetical protein